MAGTGNDQRDSGWNEFTNLQDDPQRDGTSGRPADVPSWSDRTPSGLRDRVDKDKAEQSAYRPRHTQRVNHQAEVVENFDHAQFVAHITDNIKFNRNGDMMITIQVPYQFKHLAMPLTDAFGIPLSFDVEIWVPYQKAVE
jgi:hypothetical protein